MYDRLITYLTHVDRVSKCLNTAVKAQNDSVGSLERMVLPTARRFPDLGAVAKDKELPSPRQVNENARDVQARELEPVEGDGAVPELGEPRKASDGEGSSQEAA